MDEALVQTFTSDAEDVCFRNLHKNGQQFTRSDEDKVRNCFWRYMNAYKVISNTLTEEFGGQEEKQ